MKKNALYKIEIENKNNDEIIESFSSLDQYHEYMADLAAEAWDSRDELDNSELFNFVTWYVVIDDSGEFRSLTPEQFRALK